MGKLSLHNVIYASSLVIDILSSTVIFVMNSTALGVVWLPLLSTIPQSQELLRAFSELNNITTSSLDGSNRISGVRSLKFQQSLRLLLELYVPTAVVNQIMAVCTTVTS